MINTRTIENARTAEAWEKYWIAGELSREEVDNSVKLASCRVNFGRRLYLDGTPGIDEVVRCGKGYAPIIAKVKHSKEKNLYSIMPASSLRADEREVYSIVFDTARKTRKPKEKNKNG